MENETLDLFQAPVSPELAAKHLATVSSFCGKNAKLAWNRRVKKMNELIEQVRLYEDRILEIVREKQPFLDEVSELRNEMMKECIHPKDQLVHIGTYIHCRFCEKKISLPRMFLPYEASVTEANDE